MSLVETLEQQAEALERDATAVRKLVDAARDLGEERVAALLAPMLGRNGNSYGNGNGNGNGHKATETTEEAPPRGRAALRQIVHGRPGLWTLRELRVEMKRRGWFTSNKGVDVAVQRLVASGEARRVSQGRYEFFAPEDRRLL